MKDFSNELGIDKTKYIVGYETKDEYFLVKYVDGI